MSDTSDSTEEAREDVAVARAAAFIERLEIIERNRRELTNAARRLFRDANARGFRARRLKAAVEKLRKVSDEAERARIIRDLALPARSVEGTPLGQWLDANADNTELPA